MGTTQVDSSPEMRKLVTEWLNSKTKNVSDGLDLLEKTGYKPHVCAIFKQNSTRQDIPKKLVNEMFNYLRYHATPKDEVHKDGPELDESGNVVDVVLTNIEKDLAIETYPAVIKQLLTEFSDLYKSRSIWHKDLKAVGESNSAESTATRKRFVLLMDAAGHRMDQLWTAIEAYKSNEALPAEDLVATPFNPEKIVIPEDDNTEGSKTKKEKELVLETTVEGLKKQSDNWRIKLSKAQNRLDFQSDKKEEKPNPMPEGPKRITVLKRIDQLREEKEAIDLALANAK